MANGYLTVSVTVAREAVPILDASVSVKLTDNEILPTVSDSISGLDFDIFLSTNESGITKTVPIGAPELSLSFIKGGRVRPYSTCDVYIKREGFIPVIVRGVQIYPGERSLLPVFLEPLYSPIDDKIIAIPDGITGENVITYIIPAPSVYDNVIKNQSYGVIALPLLAKSVYIPEFITVHLGVPDEDADNVYIPFSQYIKNVASSEIYPTWPEPCLRANIHAQISIALNRVYTEWYESRGYPFQITNSTAYDQAYVDGRNIFANISELVDEIFNTYIRRQGFVEPLYSTYCDGVRVSCTGMSQWGSVELANEGYTPISILRYYYGRNIELATTENIRGIEESYPGTPLSFGDLGNDVMTVQTQLNRIRRDYPEIPIIALANGRFGSDTNEAVRAFQSIFDLDVTGVVDRATWYRISYIYVSVTRLAELTSEGQRPDFPDSIPEKVLRIGDSGVEVLLLQYLLSYVGLYYNSVPIIERDSFFGSETESAVRAFQSSFSLTEDGIVGEKTWTKLFEIYNDILTAVAIDDDSFAYPGYELSLGSEGESVDFIQNRLFRISKSYPVIATPERNGIFGEATRASVIDFQRRFDLDVTGIVDSATWIRIVEIYNFLESRDGN